MMPGLTEMGKSRHFRPLKWKVLTHIHLVSVGRDCDNDEMIEIGRPLTSRIQSLSAVGSCRLKSMRLAIRHIQWYIMI